MLPGAYFRSMHETNLRPQRANFKIRWENQQVAEWSIGKSLLEAPFDHRSIDWLIDWLVDWLIDWLIDWLTPLYPIFIPFFSSPYRRRLWQSTVHGTRGHVLATDVQSTIRSLALIWDEVSDYLSCIAAFPPQRIWKYLSAVCCARISWLPGRKISTNLSTPRM